MNFKMFTGMTNFTSDLERRINGWMESIKNLEILDMKINTIENTKEIIIIFLYKKVKEQ